MNSQSPTNEPFDRREARRQRRAARLASPAGGGAWIVGLILILLGTAYLWQNIGSFTIPFKNWWAFFILIPAIGAFDRAARMYRSADNRFTAHGRAALLVGLVLILVAAGFLFNISWTFFGPVLIILAGLGILVNYMIPGKR